MNKETKREFVKDGDKIYEVGHIYTNKHGVKWLISKKDILGCREIIFIGD
jgi:hypothetical protein